MTRVAIYVRVSTSEQAKEGFSLAAQLDRLRHHAAAQGWTIAGTYSDEGQSARTDRRPAYMQMMDERDTWDTLLVLKMDRVHRNSRNFLSMMDDFRKHGKDFASVTEALDTSTAMGRFVMNVIQGIAELESDQIGERTLIGMEQKASEGKGGLGGPAPFGYRWESGKLAIVPEEAKVVWKIFAGKSYLDLNKSGHKTRQGKPFSYWNVKAILENSVYFGHYAWSGTVQKNAHPAIIPEKDANGIPAICDCVGLGCDHIGTQQHYLYQRPK